jgi:large subunit ribosomal protein L24
MPIDASNVLVVCGSCDKPARLGVKVLADGGRVRACKKCGADNGKIRAAKAAK